MAVSRLGLFDLLAPQYLAGLQLPDQVHRYLSLLGIDTFNSSYTDHFILYTGNASFRGDGSGSSEIVHEEPNGARFTWERENIRFRMVIPRNGAGFVDTAVNDFDASDSTDDGKLPAAAKLLNDLRPQPNADMDLPDAAVVDYPAVSFRLEFLVDVLNFSLGEDWVPGWINPSDKRIKPDPEHRGKRVMISLPQVLISYTQGDNAGDLDPVFRIESWGIAGFDAPRDLAMGELIRMQPGIALHKSGHIAFSIDKVILDASQDATPPELIDHFGIDEDWTGIYIGQALIYYSNEQGIGFNFRVNDALISFAGEVSLEAALDIYVNTTLSKLTVTPVFYNGSERVELLSRGIIDPAVNSAPGTAPAGRVRVEKDAVMQLEMSGGMPPYTVQVRQGSQERWDTASRQVRFPDTGDQDLFIRVTDSSGGVTGPLAATEYIRVTVTDSTQAPEDGMPEDRPATAAPQALAPFNISGNDASHELLITEHGTTVTLEVRGPEPFTLDLSGSQTTSYTNQRQIRLNVPNGTDLAVALHFPAIPAGTMNPVYDINFNYNRPRNSAAVAAYVSGSSSSFSPATDDTQFTNSFRHFFNNRPDTATVQKIKLEGWASFDVYANGTHSSSGRDQELSGLRNDAVRRNLALLYPSATFEVPVSHGHTSLPNSTEPFDRNNPDHTNDENRLVKISFTSHAVPATHITATISRPAAPATPAPAAPESGHPPAAAPAPNNVPPVLKQMGIRLKIERNRLSLLELYGKIDFQTELEDKIRNAPGSGVTAANGSLDLQGANTHDGITDFKLCYQYDQAINETTLIFKIYSDDEDTDGLFHTDNPERDGNRLKNIAGALLVFAPIINSAATAVGSDVDNPGAWMALGASLAVPVFIGGAGFFLTRRITLFGGEARTRFVAPAPGESPRSVDFGLVFDYEVQFDIVCEQLEIGKDRMPGAPGPLPPPLRARYKAIGFNINYSDTPAYKGFTYTPVFDASRGYDLDLSDPSLFRLPDPMGQLFQIAGARLARFNPVTLEIDFQIKVDLGIITVDKFKLKIPLDPGGPPQIIPSGVKVNIPGVLTGNGFVEIVNTEIADKDGNITTAKGIEGGLDLTLVSLKVRVAANIGVGTLKDAATGREAISVFLGMTVKFPTPIVLGATGLGIYGFMGLFAMHYRRLEADPDPTKAVGPALNWLIKADGDPTRLRTKNGDNAALAMLPAGPKLWEMAFDRWSFGIGVLLGTTEGGMLLNMQGMLVLELPGPRILIMVKVQIVNPLPSQPPTPAKNLETGILGIVDIDFGRQQLTLGVMLNFSIEQVLAITIPVELFFKWDNPANWHLYLGTIAQPASATILDIVRGNAYLMIQGNELVYADYGSRVPAFLQDKRLNGIAIAVGLEAALTLGSESAGVYLKIAAGAHLGVSFAPFLVVGTMYFSGMLRLVIISIGANGHFDLMVTKRRDRDELKVYFRGEVCGSIDLFFFEISACVGISSGDEDYDIVAPPLVRGVYLQSFSPVLSSGQGSSRPIDASLGNAFDVATGALPADLLQVPIDSLPVIQFHAAPQLGGQFDLASFIRQPGNISGTAGELVLSDEVKVVYTLNAVTLTEDGIPYTSDIPGEKPPAVWRIDRPKNGSVTDTAIDLATFSRTPATAPHAIERSTELNTTVNVRWENACKAAAPPAPVLYTFCDQPLGFSRNGWTLTGTPKPDPEGTIRTQAVNKTMRIYQYQGTAAFSSLDMLLDNMGYATCNQARISGIDNINVQFPETRKQRCISLEAKKIGYQANPLVIEKELKIFSAEDKKTFYNSKGFIRHTELKPFESPYRTHYRSIGKKIALSIREYMRIDLLQEGADEVQLRFTCYNTKAKERPRMVISAYNEKGKKLDEQIFVDQSTREEIHSITLRGKQIRHLIIYNRNFTGQLLEVCYTRINRPDLSALANYLRCVRSLQLPYCASNNAPLAPRLREYVKDPELLAKYLDQREDCGHTIFETGACSELLFYGALHLKARKGIMVAELDDTLKVIREYPLEDLIEKEVNTPLTDLPADWLSTAVPWRSSVVALATYLHSGFFNAYKRILFRVKPSDPSVTRIRISTCISGPEIPALFISAIAALQLSEIQHHGTVTEMQHTEQHTLNSYLNDSDLPIPLLRPGKTYQLSVSYTTEIYTRKSRQDTFSLKYNPAAVSTQSFAFRTDETPPQPMSPYVLGTTPEMDDQYHFYQDALKIVFNDAAFLRMYTSYGKSLKAVIRGADGKPVDNSPEPMQFTGSIPAQVKTPYRAAVEAMISEGLLPCSGSINVPQHPVYEPAFLLKPLMPYTLDIEFDPADPVAANASVQPLFRRAFRTSRYANLEDLVKDLSAKALRHKALNNTIAGLPFAAAAPGQVFTCTDTDFEQLLATAGMRPDVAGEMTGFTLLWANKSGDFVPYGLLIDASEPLWRSRKEACPKKVLNEQLQEIDPNFFIYEDQDVPAMRLREKSGQQIVSQFIRSTGGTRSLALFSDISWPPAGTVLSILIAQTASTFYALPEKELTLLELFLDGKAPWEE